MLNHGISHSQHRFAYFCFALDYLKHGFRPPLDHSSASSSATTITTTGHQYNILFLLLLSLKFKLTRTQNSDLTICLLICISLVISSQFAMAYISGSRIHKLHANTWGIVCTTGYNACFLLIVNTMFNCPYEVSYSYEKRKTP